MRSWLIQEHRPAEIYTKFSTASGRNKAAGGFWNVEQGKG